MISHCDTPKVAHYSYSEQNQDGLPKKVKMGSEIALKGDKIKLYEKHILPLDKEIIRLYEIYRISPGKNGEMLKALKQLHEAREVAIAALGL